MKTTSLGLPGNIFIPILAFLAVCGAQAQRQRTVSINGDVEDGFLKVPLPQAKVSVCRADSSVVVDSATMIRFYNRDRKIVKAHYGAEVSASEREYLVHAHLRGYEDVWQRVAVAEGQVDVEVPKLQMYRMRSVNLDGVTVRATKIKMFHRGDTLIYDATAFQLPDGSMLDDLIRQLPGVTMNDEGEIFVGGRKVDELLLGSRSFFGGNKQVLMENLPYYTVKNLKVYERQTDKSAALGYDVEPRRYVMDVNLKDEYREGGIGNAEVAGGTNKRWLGRGFLLGFTDRLRLTLLGNANNVNEGRHIGQSDQWNPARQPRSLTTTRSVAGEIDYHTAGDKLKETFRADYTSSTDEQTMSQRREQFLTGYTPTSLTESAGRSGIRKLSLHNSLTLSKPCWLRTEADFNYIRRNGSSGSSFDEWGERRRVGDGTSGIRLRVGDGTSGISLTISQRTVGMSEGKAWNGYLEVQSAIPVGKKRHIDLYAKVEHSTDESEQAQRFQTRGNGNDLQHNANDLFSRSTWGTARLGYAQEIAKDLHLNVTDFFFIRSQHRRDYLYHPDTLLLPSQIDAIEAFTDPNNSYESRDRDWSNNLIFRFMKPAEYMHPDFHMKVQYERWCLTLRLPVQHEQLHYQRLRVGDGTSGIRLRVGDGTSGTLDTLARQTVFLPNATFQYRNVWKGGRRDFHFTATFNQERNVLLDRINIRDDSQPLVVKLGNPDLRPSAVSKLDVEYYDKTGPRNGMYYGSASFNYHHRDVAQSVSYNPATSVYTYQPMNVSGAWGALTNFSTDQTIDKNRYWTWHVNAGVLWDHAKDHAMLEGQTESHVNTVNTLGLNGGANIRFDRKGLNIRATGHINWRHSEGKMYDFSTLNALDFEYGLEATYTLPRTKTTFAADGTMFSRRYGSADLNSNDFIVNASVSQPFLKGNLIVRLEAFDLLHQLSGTQYTINAQGRTVTWYRSLPHYAMLHIVYHFSRNPNEVKGQRSKVEGQRAKGKGRRSKV